MQGKKCTLYKRNFCLLQLFSVYVCGVLGSNHRAENTYILCGSNPCKAKQIYVDENLTQLVVGTQ